MIQTYSQRRKTIHNIHDITEHADTPDEVALCLETCKKVDGKSLVVVDKGNYPGYIIKYTIDDNNPVIRDTYSKMQIEKVIENILGREL